MAQGTYMSSSCYCHMYMQRIRVLLGKNHLQDQGLREVVKKRLMEFLFHSSNAWPGVNDNLEVDVGITEKNREREGGKPAQAVRRIQG